MHLWFNHRSNGTLWNEKQQNNRGYFILSLSNCPSDWLCISPLNPLRCSLMALTMEFYSTHGGGTNRSNCVFVCVGWGYKTVCTWAPCNQEWMKGNDGPTEAHSHWEKRKTKKGDWWRSTECYLLKWKIMPRCRRNCFCPLGEVTTSTRGTQVLLNTLAFVPHHLPLSPPSTVIPYSPSLLHSRP